MQKAEKRNLSAAKKTALTGMLAAATLALAYIERLLTAALPLPPGVRPGLSNVAVMFACIALGLPFALGIAVIKSGFVFLLSGAYAGVISLCGGVLSVLGVFVLTRPFCKRLSYTGVSVASAVLHNAGQLAAASAIVGSGLYLWLAPVLLVSGVVFGCVTGLLLNAVLPALLKLIPHLIKTSDKSA